MVLSEAVSFTTCLSFAGVVIALVAAAATLRAVYWAHETVKDAKRNAAADAMRHKEQIDQMRSATEAAAEQHRVEMEDRRQRQTEERFSRQLAQLDRVAAVVADIREVANEARRNQERQIDSPLLPMDRLPTLCIRLEHALAVLQARGVEAPPKAVELARTARGLGAAPVHIVGDSVDLLEIINQRMREVGAQAMAAEGAHFVGEHEPLSGTDSGTTDRYE